MVRPIKKKQIVNLQERIKQVAWRQSAELGAAALSLRAIGRELKITAPAIYNYFPRRDDLVTALIVDAFNSLADAEEASVANLPADNFASRFATIGRAYRLWALTYPERYSLIFGTPISGYEAPSEITAPAATRSLNPLLSVLESARKAGKLKLPAAYAEISAEFTAQLQKWRAVQPEFDVRVLHIGLAIWGMVHGLVSLEVYNQLPPMIRNTDEIFEIEINSLLGKFMK